MVSIAIFGLRPTVDETGPRFRIVFPFDDDDVCRCAFGTRRRVTVRKQTLLSPQSKTEKSFLLCALLSVRQTVMTRQTRQFNDDLPRKRRAASSVAYVQLSYCGGGGGNQIILYTYVYRRP